MSSMFWPELEVEAHPKEDKEVMKNKMQVKFVWTLFFCDENRENTKMQQRFHILLRII